MNKVWENNTINKLLNDEKSTINKTELKEYENIKQKEENIKRYPICINKNTIFQDLNKEQIEWAKLILKDVLENTRYNTFERISQIVNKKELNPNKSLLDSFNETDFNDYDKLNSDCYWLSSKLKDKLSKIWIYSYFIRFGPWRRLNDEYLPNWHVAVCIPRIIMWEKAYTIMDPWMLISEPITFYDWKNTLPQDLYWKMTSVHKQREWIFPYMLMVDWKKLYFDPYNTWKNPWETLSRDFLSSTWDFKIVKQDKNWKNISYLKIDLQDNSFIFKSMKLKIKFSFNEFRKLKENSNNELYINFKQLASDLGENDIEEFYNKILQFLNNLDDYKKNIWVPSTLEKSRNNNNLLTQ